MRRTATLFVLTLTVAFAMSLLFGVTVFADPTPGQQVHLPILTWLGDEADACSVVIEVQNVGDEFTKAAILFWGAPGACPPQCNGPFKVECSGLLKPGSTWNFIGPDAPAQVPAGAKKGIVFSLRADQGPDGDEDDIVADAVCEALFANVRSDCDEYRRFKKSFDENDGAVWWGTTYGIAGEPLAVEVVRKCQTAEMDAPVVSAYSGISEWELGWADPVFGGGQVGWMYYTPLLYADQDGLNSWIYIQNAGLECTSVEIWLKQQGECIRSTIDEIPALAPGETIQYNVSDLMGPFWQGNAWIRTSVPAAIAVDNWSNEVLMTYVGRPAEINFTFDPNDPNALTVGSQVNFGPLIYREHQGWNTNIQVQNLSSVVNAKVKVYFLDNSGDIIKTVVDWICPRGTQTFPLAVIDGLPGNWVGTVRVESQEWWTPGDPKVLPPNIISIAELIRWDGPAQTVLLEGVAYNLFPEWQAYDWQVGWDGGVDLIGIPSFMNNMSGGGETGLTTELAIQNVVAKPGFTDFAIYIYDQNGLLDYVCEKLNEKQVEYINVADDWNYINDGFKGSAVISVTSWEHHGSYSPGLAAVKVERFNWPLVPSTDPADDAPGDQASASEGFPIVGPFDFEGPQTAPPCPGQPATCTGDVLGAVVAFDYEKNEIDPEGNEVIAGAALSGGGDSTTTDGAGTYELHLAPGVSEVTAEGPTVSTNNADDADVPATVGTITTAAHFPLTKEVRVACFEDSDLDFTLICKALLCGSVEISGTATPISGATVSLAVDANDQPEGVADSFPGGIYNTSTQTNSTGDYCLEVPLIGDNDGDNTNDAAWTLTVAATGFNDFTATGVSFANDNQFDSDECLNNNTSGDLEAKTFDPDPVDMCSLGSFSGVVWSDLDGQGDIDAGEPLREGLVVSLIDDADSVVATTTTDANGFYLFSDLDTTITYRVSVSDIETANQTLVCDEDSTIDFDLLNDAVYVR
ncbi:MAG: SdrD B-like domain-containing protein [Dehalococcoidia bacterium]